jgi:hypothetical protein
MFLWQAVEAIEALYIGLTDKGHLALGRRQPASYKRHWVVASGELHVSTSLHSLKQRGDVALRWNSMLQTYILSVSGVCCKCFTYGCCKTRSKILHMLYMLQVSYECCKRLFKNISYVSDVCLEAFLIWMLYMFHTYIARVCRNVSSVLVLCSSKCFHVAS